MVSIVPTKDFSDNSATLAENCAESAIIETPQIKQMITTNQGAEPYKGPMINAQVPLITIAKIVDFVRPHRSAKYPPPMQPMAPIPMVAKVAYFAQKKASP